MLIFHLDINKKWIFVQFFTREALLYASIVRMCIVLLLKVTKKTYTSLSFRVGLKLCQKSKGLAYDIAKNQYPQCTVGLHHK